MAKNTTSIFQAFASYSFFTLLSRISGLTRDIVIARYLGSGLLSDMFFTAFKIPNWFRRTLGDGVVSPAFVPIFTKIVDEDRQKAREFSGSTMIILGILAANVTLLLCSYSDVSIKIIVPGFAKKSCIINQISEMLSINAPLLISAAMVAIMGGTLSGIHVFKYFAAIPIAINLSLILFLIYLRDYFQNSAICLSYAVLFGAIIQPLIMLYGCYKHNIMPIVKFPIRIDKQIEDFFRRAIPVAIGEGTNQLNTLIGSIFMSFSRGGISYMHYTDRIIHFITTITGHAIGLASLPILSRKLSSGQIEEAKCIQLECITLALFLSIPATMTLVMFSDQITASFYQRGNFTAIDTQFVSMMLIICSPVLILVALGLVFKTCMFAMGDTKTPMKIGILSIIINAICNIILLNHIQYYSVLISYDISTVFEAIFIGFALKKKHNFFPKPSKIIIIAAKVSLASTISGLIMFFLEKYLITGNMSTMFLIMPIGGIIYIIIANAMNIINISDIRNSILHTKS